MRRASNAFVELLAGKTAEAMYDALYAGRYLSAKGQDSPSEVLTIIKMHLRSSRQRSLMPPTLLDRLTHALVSFGFLNDAGKRLAAQEVNAE